MKVIGRAAMSLFLISIIALVAVYSRNEPATWAIALFAAALLAMMALLTLWEDSFASFDWSKFWRIALGGFLGAALAVIVALFVFDRANTVLAFLEAAKIFIEGETVNDTRSTFTTAKEGRLNLLQEEWAPLFLLIMVAAGAILGGVTDDFVFLKPSIYGLIGLVVLGMVFTQGAVFPKKPDTPVQVRIPGVEDAEFDPSVPSLKYTSDNKERTVKLVEKELIELGENITPSTPFGRHFAPTMVGTADGVLFVLYRPTEGEKCDDAWVEYPTFPKPHEWLTKDRSSTGLIMVRDDESQLVIIGDNLRARDGVLEDRRRAFQELRGDDLKNIKPPDGCSLSVAYPPSPERYPRLPERPSPSAHGVMSPNS